MITIKIEEDGKPLVVLCPHGKRKHAGIQSKWHKSDLYDTRDVAYFSGNVQLKDRGMDYSINIERPNNKVISKITGGIPK